MDSLLVCISWIDPDQDIELLTVPSAETLQSMRNGTIDCFSTGDPWPSRIANDDIGYQAALTGQMWPFHPEEFLAVRADWVDKHPKATIALLMGLMEAQQWCDQRENRAEMAKILSGRNFFNVPVSILQPILEGQIKVGADGKDLNNFEAGLSSGRALAAVSPIPIRFDPVVPDRIDALGLQQASATGCCRCSETQRSRNS